MTPGLREAQRAAGLPDTTFHDRLTATGPDEQALYRVLLRSLAHEGRAPRLSSATRTAHLTEDQARSAFDRLAAEDLITLTAEGHLVGVFPLSAVPTRHQVVLDDGRELYAMCAVDALGVPAMLGQAATVLSTDPCTGAAITITISEDTVRAAPASTVILLGREGDGPLASACCRVIDFYSDEHIARSALDAPALDGTVLSLRDAHELGVALFASLPAR